MNVVVYVAHVDDESIFIGGTACYFADVWKASIYIVYASNGIVVHGRSGRNYREEAQKICHYLGINKRQVHFLNVPTMEFEKYGQLELNKRFESLRLRPDIIITHSEHDVNEDHKIVYKSALIQARCYCKKVSLLCCEYIGNSVGFVPNFYVDISTYMEKKMNIIHVIDCEIMEFPHPRSYKAIEARASVRGSECGCEYAEAFEVKRWIL